MAGQRFRAAVEMWRIPPAITTYAAGLAQSAFTRRGHQEVVAFFSDRVYSISMLCYLLLPFRGEQQMLLGIGAQRRLLRAGGCWLHVCCLYQKYENMSPDLVNAPIIGASCAPKLSMPVGRT